MICPHCESDLGDGMLPARCPHCGHNLANLADAPGGAAGAKKAQETRESARGLAGGSDYQVTKGKRFGPVLTFLAIATFIALAVFLSWRLELWGGNSLPDVVGWNIERAQTDLEKLGYTVSSETQKDDEAPGIVIAMSPRAGKRLDPGTEVHLVVSEGRYMPEVVGKTRDEVIQLMDAEGLSYDFEEVIDDGEENIVLSATSAAGTRLSSDTTVSFTVSIPRLVPEVLDKEEKDAYGMLVDKGYEVKTVSVVKKKDQKDGIVVACEPSPGTKLEKGATVTISVTRDRIAKLKEKSEQILKIVYDWNPQTTPNGIEALRELIDPKLKIAGKSAAEASVNEIWYSFVKAGKKAQTGISEKIDQLPRSLKSIDSVEVADDGTVTCKITVSWDWSPLGDDYKQVSSTDTRTVILSFNEENQLVSFNDAKGDAPEYNVVEVAAPTENSGEQNSSSN